MNDQTELDGTAQDQPFRLSGLKIEMRMPNRDQVQAAIAALGALVEADPAITDEQIADRAAGIIGTLRFEARFADGPWKPFHFNLSGYVINVNGRQAQIVPPEEGDA